MAKLLQNKFLLLFLLSNLYTYCGYAQFSKDEEDERTFYGGISVGGNFSQVDGDNFAGFHKAGWNAGVIVYTKLADRLAVGLELLYAQKGSRAGQNQVPKVGNDQNTIIFDYKIKLNYAEIPVIINYFDKRSNHFGAGLSYSRLFRSSELYKDGTGTTFENDSKIYPFRKSDLSFIVNANAHIWKGLFWNLRYHYSLISIRNTYNPITGRDQQFNNVWSTRLMYIF